MHDLGFLYLVTKQLYNPEILQVNKGSVETSCRMNMAKQGREMCLSLCLFFFVVSYKIIVVMLIEAMQILDCI